jgi:glycosyltransferase involved in cell wall biosynthesis
LLKAFQEFRGPGCTLTVAGSRLGDPGIFGPYEDLFTYLGHLNRPALAEAFRQSDVFVFPTLIEGMPLTVLEAMACGLPVITTSHGPGDLVRDGVDGFIIPIRDHRAIAEKLVYLRENPDRRLEMGRNARIRALDYTWDQYGSRVLDTLSRLSNPASVVAINSRLSASLATRV